MGHFEADRCRTEKPEKPESLAQTVLTITALHCSEGEFKHLHQSGAKQRAATHTELLKASTLWLSEKASIIPQLPSVHARQPQRRGNFAKADSAEY